MQSKNKSGNSFVCELHLNTISEYLYGNALEILSMGQCNLDLTVYGKNVSSVGSELNSASNSFPVVIGTLPCLH